MNSAALLDLLGNENRRRILRLLARKPCYVTEMSEYLGVSPKAIIDHLRKLEDAGLIESQVDDQRRKYFHIARNLRLEVELSPYRFGTKSAYPASVNLDLTRCRYLTLEVEDVQNGRDDGGNADPMAASTEPGPRVEDDDGGSADPVAASTETDPHVGNNDGDPEALTEESPTELAGRLRRLERLEEELSLAQRWVQGRLTETMDMIGEAVDRQTDAGLDSRLYSDVLLALEDGKRTVEGISEAAGTPPELVEEALAALAEAGLVDRRDAGWVLVPG